jgi:N-succinyldiaminopimelate aminotransferase
MTSLVPITQATPPTSSPENDIGTPRFGQMPSNPISEPCLNPNLSRLPVSPFARLNHLLKDITPPKTPIINAAVGDPQADIAAELRVPAAESGAWRRYPPISGIPPLREAMMSWLRRRHNLSDSKILSALDVIPTAGTREAIFLAAVLSVTPATDGEPPCVLIPSPSYPGYFGSGVMVGASVVPLPARSANGFLPELDTISEETLRRTQLMFITNPTNPEGAAPSPDYLARLAALSRKHDFVLVADECCLDLYTRDRPTGIIEVFAKADLPIDRLLILNSLSKRSYAAGLRSGFVAGGKALIARLTQLRSYTGATVPIPVQEASAKLWSDETHVELIRQDLDRKFDIAEQFLVPRFGPVRPDSGFFLWLPVQNDVEATRELWRLGIKVMPGSYIGHETADGNTGTGYIRVALVHSLADTARMIETIARVI